MVGVRRVTYQWHVFLASLNPVRGSEQSGRRPVLIVSREEINQVLPVVNTVPLTSRKIGRRVYPNEALVRRGTAGCGWIRSRCATRSALSTSDAWKRNSEKLRTSGFGGMLWKLCGSNWTSGSFSSTVARARLGGAARAEGSWRSGARPRRVEDGSHVGGESGEQR